MPSLVRRELETLFRDEFQDIEEHVKPRVAEIVLNLQPRLLQLYKKSTETAPSESDLTSPRTLSSAEASSTPATAPSHTSLDVSPFDNFDWSEWEASSSNQPSSTAGTDEGLNWDMEFDTLFSQTLFPNIPVQFEGNSTSINEFSST